MDEPTPRYCRQIEPPNEAVAESAQVAISVLFRTKGMKLPLKLVFQVC